MRCSATNRDEVASHRLPKVITASLEMKKHEGGRPYDTILPPTGIYPYIDMVEGLGARIFNDPRSHQSA
jgi:hypothetical protein